MKSVAALLSKPFEPARAFATVPRRAYAQASPDPPRDINGKRYYAIYYTFNGDANDLPRKREPYRQEHVDYLKSLNVLKLAGALGNVPHHTHSLMVVFGTLQEAQKLTKEDPCDFYYFFLRLFYLHCLP